MGLSLDRFTARGVYRGYPRPRRFERNLVVIGGGSAGLVSAYIAAAVKASVSLVEAERMGGDCLYTGCVPSKSLLRTAKFLHDVARCEALGVRRAEADFDFAEVMGRVRRVIAAIAPHDSPQRYTELGVDCIAGTASLESPWAVRVGDRTLTTRAIVIATGARPFLPPIPGLEAAPHLTSETLWDLDALPARLAVLGGGPIGCEMAQAFARLGSAVTLVEMGERILPAEDPEAAALVAGALAEDGVEILTGHRATAVARHEAQWTLRCEYDGGERQVPFERLLVAVGRRASTAGLGLEALGIDTGPDGTIAVDEYLQTRFPNVLACGDVIAPWQFTHAASHEAYYAASNALFGDLWKQRVDYSALPWTTFTDPEVAHLGLNETRARREGVAYELTEHRLEGLDRALAEEDARGFVRVLTVPGRDRILGVTIVGPHAGELLAEFVLARRHGIGLKGILGSIHSYPTLAEANKFAAGAWRRAHQPTRVLEWVRRFHAWRRG